MCVWAVALVSCLAARAAAHSTCETPTKIPIAHSQAAFSTHTSGRSQQWPRARPRSSYGPRPRCEPVQCCGWSKRCEQKPVLELQQGGLPQERRDTSAHHLRSVIERPPRHARRCVGAIVAPHDIPSLQLQRGDSAVICNHLPTCRAALSAFFTAVFALPSAPTRCALALVVFLTPLADAPLCLRESLLSSRRWSRQPSPPCQCAPPGPVNV